MERRELLASLVLTGLAGCTTGPSEESSPQSTNTETEAPTPTPTPTETEIPTPTPTPTPHPSVSEDRLLEFNNFYEIEDGLRLTMDYMLRLPEIQWRPMDDDYQDTETPQLRRLEADPGEAFVIFTYYVENESFEVKQAPRFDEFTVVLDGTEYEPLQQLPNGEPLSTVETRYITDPEFFPGEISVDSAASASFLTVAPYAEIPYYAFKWDRTNDGIDPIYWYVPPDMVEGT